MNELFQTNDYPYDLRNPRILTTKYKSTLECGIDIIVFKGPQI